MRKRDKRERGAGREGRGEKVKRKMKNKGKKCKEVKRVKETTKKVWEMKIGEEKEEGEERNS